MKLTIKITKKQAQYLLKNIVAGKPIKIKAGDLGQILDKSQPDKKPRV